MNNTKYELMEKHQWINLRGSPTFKKLAHVVLSVTNVLDAGMGGFRLQLPSLKKQVFATNLYCRPIKGFASRDSVLIAVFFSKYTATTACTAK